MSTPSYDDVKIREAEADAFRRVEAWAMASREELSNIVSALPKEAAWEAGMVQALYLMIDDGLREHFANRASLAASVAASMRGQRAAARELDAQQLLEDTGWVWQSVAIPEEELAQRETPHAGPRFRGGYVLPDIIPVRKELWEAVQRTGELYEGEEYGNRAKRLLGERVVEELVPARQAAERAKLATLHEREREAEETAERR